MAHIDLGVCYFCGKHVFAAPGQRVTYKNRKGYDRNTHEMLVEESLPTHKKCRKP